MPKKDKDKNSGKPAKMAEPVSPLPQVWLPDQLELVRLIYDKGPLVTAEEGNNLAPPTADEQESMAKFWAMEERHAPKGWEHEEEIDYEELYKKSETKRMEESQNSGGDTSLFSYAQTSSFNVHFLGHIPSVLSRVNVGSPESQISTLEAINTAQKQGRVPWVTDPEGMRILSLSKYGIKVTDEKKQKVFSRHPLHCIANITYYEDTYGKHMVALRIGQPQVSQPQPSKASHNELHVYECSNEAQAKDICLTMAQAFDAVYNKIKLERNSHNSDNI